MQKQKGTSKKKEWLSRYIPAEVLGTIAAVIGAWAVYAYTDSYAAATAAGWVGEGIGFYGYFVSIELLKSHKRHQRHSPVKRAYLATTEASTNLLVEFLPAELLDNLIIRPLAMFTAPHYIHPYPVGFLIGTLIADLFFFAFAIVGYEARKRQLRR